MERDRVMAGGRSRSIPSRTPYAEWAHASFAPISINGILTARVYTVAMVRRIQKRREAGHAGAGLSLRTRILPAFCTAALITLALGVFAVRSVERSGGIVVDIFGQGLIATSYARSAAANFAAMDAAFARRHLATEAGSRDAEERRLSELAALTFDDLGIAAQRSASEAVSRAAEAARLAVQAWSEAARASHGAAAPDWNRLADLAEEANERFEVLVNHLAGDAFRQRRRAQEAIAATQNRTAAGTGVALLFGIAVALLLSRRIIGPVAAASAAASGIAAGRLDTPIPAGGRDELGVLLRAMGQMRDAIQATVESEKAERRSAQGRLADAMEGSTEGVVLTDASGRISAVNARARELLPGARSLLVPGADWPGALRAGLGAGSARAVLPGKGPSVAEVRRDDGAWLRLSCSPAREGGAVTVLSDVSNLKAQEQELAEANRRISAALGNMAQGLCMVGADGRVLVCNSRFAGMFALPPADTLAGAPVGEVFAAMIAAGAFSPNLLASVEEEQRALAARPKALSFLRQGPDGEALAVSHEPMPSGGWVATYEDATERRRAEERIAFLAHHDALTGLPNRTLFRERAEQAAAELGRGRGFAVLCLDLDGFKTVNDTLGHAVGDQLLRAVAERLIACARSADTVARLGGDEFAVVQAGANDPGDAELLAGRVLEALGQPFELDGHRVVVGASVGIALAPRDGAQSDRLLRCADTALYRAKAAGRGAHRFFEPEMDARLLARRTMELDLRGALAADELELCYQPLVNLEAGRVCGFEALLRWRHPERGMISPAEFIPLAEETGLIVPIGAWALRRACLDASAWPEHVRVAVNVSPVQFRGPGLFEAVAGALSDAGLPASRLELEITESVMLHDSAATLGILRRLHDLGVLIAMDDFGTGYSSLGYLRSFPFDKIKIDQSFIRDLPKEGGAEAIVRAITGLGSSLGMRTTAEGVETEAQLSRLRAEGCTEVQGYLFGRPGPAADVPRVVHRINARHAAADPV